MLQLDLVSILVIAAVLLNLLLAVKVASQPTHDRLAKGLLLFVLLCLAALLANQLYRYRVTRLYAVFPQLSGTTLLLTFCLGPALYVYIRRLAYDVRPWAQRLWYLHWVLPIALELYLIPTFGQTAQEKFASFRSEQARTFRLAIYLTNYLQILLYVYLCREPLRVYKKRILDNFSDGRNSSVEWLNKTCWGLAGVVLLGIVTALSGPFFAQLYPLMLVVSALFVVTIAYLGLSHGQIPVVSRSAESAPDEKLQAERTAAVAIIEKYARSGLQNDTAQYFLNKLQTLMAQEHYFLDDSLSLSSLADKLNLSTHHLSQLLNEQLQTTFYDYINSQRIDYAKHMLCAEPKRPVVDIAVRSGYDNKGTFYRAFKSRTGMTPAEYRERKQTDLEPPATGNQKNSTQ